MSLAGNNVTHISCLVAGDRFYLVSDKKKTVWQLGYHTSIWFRGHKLMGAFCSTDAGRSKRFLAKRVVVHLKSQKKVVRDARGQQLKITL